MSKSSVKDKVDLALMKLNNGRGASLYAIKNFINVEFQHDPKNLNSNLKKAIGQGVEGKRVIQLTGVGATGTFRLSMKAQRQVASAKGLPPPPARKRRSNSAAATLAPPARKRRSTSPAASSPPPARKRRSNSAVPVSTEAPAPSKKKNSAVSIEAPAPSKMKNGAVPKISAKPVKKSSQKGTKESVPAPALSKAKSQPVHRAARKFATPINELDLD